ncbi:MAG TPA: DUF3301 domain-containing protein [Rhodocyclaceae bacterium]|nr:DUF3301 domain-containing protein [Rhodocyclaceae bacterium]
MPLLQVLGLLLLGAATWLWMDSLSAREVCVPAARAACEAEGLLFLDDTVSIESLWPVRDENGRLTLRRVYGFEYSETGRERRRGSVTMLGRTVLTLYIRPRLVTIGPPD